MKGIAKVQLLDKNRKCVHEEKGHNIITDLYINMFHDLVKALKQPYTNGITPNIPNITPLNLSNGILLLKDPQIESANTIFPKGKITGYAGGDYAGDDFYRGTINIAETGVIPGEGYRHTWEFITSQGNGLISALALCPIDIGNGDLVSKRLAENTHPICTGKMTAAAETGYAPDAECVDDEGNFYSYWQHGYIKGNKKAVSYKTSYRNSNNIQEFDMSSSNFELCSRPQFYKGKIWLVASEIGTGNYYLLRITKDTTTIEQQWLLGDIGENYPNHGIAIGITDTHLMWIPEGESFARTFNLDTSVFQNTGALSYGAYGVGSRAIHWYCAEDQAIVTGASSTHSSIRGRIYGDVIYSEDLSIRHLKNESSSNSGIEVFMPFGDKPYGYGCFNEYIMSHLTMAMPLFSVKNLETPLNKTDEFTLKVVYDLLY